jgi:hypothetical protein
MHQESSTRCHCFLSSRQQTCVCQGPRHRWQYLTNYLPTPHRLTLRPFHSVIRRLARPLPSRRLCSPSRNSSFQKDNISHTQKSCPVRVGKRWMIESSWWSRFLKLGIQRYVLSCCSVEALKVMAQFGTTSSVYLLSSTSIPVTVGYLAAVNRRLLPGPHISSVDPDTV